MNTCSGPKTQVGQSLEILSRSSLLPHGMRMYRVYRCSCGKARFDTADSLGIPTMTLCVAQGEISSGMEAACSYVFFIFLSDTPSHTDTETLSLSLSLSLPPVSCSLALFWVCRFRAAGEACNRPIEYWVKCRSRNFRLSRLDSDGLLSFALASGFTS